MTYADARRLSYPSYADQLRDEILHSLLDGRARYRVDQTDEKTKRPITLPKLNCLNPEWWR